MFLVESAFHFALSFLPFFLLSQRVLFFFVDFFWKEMGRVTKREIETVGKKRKRDWHAFRHFSASLPPFLFLV